MFTAEQRRILWAGALVAAALVTGHAQSPPQEPEAQLQQPTFHIGVDAVRIDAVVTDARGNVVTDLTADDFELKDDGRPQKVTLATFVPVASGPVSGSAQTDAAWNAPPAVRPLARDEVQRSLLVLVDDLGISFEGMYLQQERASHVHRSEPAADGSGRAHTYRDVCRHAASVHDGPAPLALGRRRAPLDGTVPARSRAVRVDRRHRPDERRRRARRRGHHRHGRRREAVRTSRK